MNYADLYFYKKLEFDHILNEIKSYSILTSTKSIIDSMQPLNSLNEIHDSLNNISEAILICTKFERAPIYLSADLAPILEIANKNGLLSSLELYEILRLHHTIKSNKYLLDQLKKEHVNAEYYSSLVEDLFVDPVLDNDLRKSIDETGCILDTASANLKRIRSKLKNIDDRIKSRILEIMAASSTVLSDNLVVIRNDRYCLCVKAEYKNSFNGLLQDSSQTGLTCYMEPFEIAKLSNEKDSLRNEEKEEINHILIDLSKQVSLNYEILFNNYETIKIIDVLFSKALFCQKYDCEVPKINNNGILNLKNARHPLLVVKKIVPNNFSFPNGKLGVIITGPNTGGKTVLLKTIGLLSLMVKFGLPIPASSESNIMIYDHIFCDIGDDQSIEANLSTFSSHMSRMVSIIDQVTPSSLVLFDEIGSGTDPLEGSSIAIAILKYFIKNKISFVTTTHYTELKTFAYSNPLVENASMAFDTQTHLPTYQLIIGKSGASNAYAIARKLGLPKEIIDSAKQINKKNQDEERKIIYELEKKQEQVSTLESKLNNLIIDNKKLSDDYESKLRKINLEKDEIITQANKKANEIIDDATLKSEILLEEIKKLQNKDVKLHEIIAGQGLINDAKGDKVVIKKPKIKKQVAHKYIVGDTVYIYDYEQYGEITRIRKNNTYDISIGNISINASKDDFELYDAPKTQSTVSYSSGSMVTKHVSMTLDLRGVRLAEAKEMLDKYIDDLQMANLKTANIIHGFGTGAIREMVQEFCKKSKVIASYRYGGEGEGGFGVTVITLK